MPLGKELINWDLNPSTAEPSLLVVQDRAVDVQLAVKECSKGFLIDFAVTCHSGPCYTLIGGL